MTPPLVDSKTIQILPVQDQGLVIPLPEESVQAPINLPLTDSDSFVSKSPDMERSRQVNGAALQVWEIFIQEGEEKDAAI